MQYRLSNHELVYFQHQTINLIILKMHQRLQPLNNFTPHLPVMPFLLLLLNISLSDNKIVTIVMLAKINKSTNEQFQ